MDDRPSLRNRDHFEWLLDSRRGLMCCVVGWELTFDF